MVNRYHSLYKNKPWLILFLALLLCGAQLAGASHLHHDHTTQNDCISCHFGNSINHAAIPASNQPLVITGSFRIIPPEVPTVLGTQLPLPPARGPPGYP